MRKIVILVVGFLRFWVVPNKSEMVNPQIGNELAKSIRFKQARVLLAKSRVPPLTFNVWMTHMVL